MCRLFFSGIKVPDEETKVNDTTNWLQESLNKKQFWVTAAKGDVAKCCPLSRLAVPGPQFHRQINQPQVQTYLKMLAQGAIPTKGNKVHKDLAIACFSLFNFRLGPELFWSCFVYRIGTDHSDGGECYRFG